MPELGVEVRGNVSSSGGGRGLMKVVFTTGTYETGGAGGTNFGDRWEVGFDGDLDPLTDGAFDIGSTASNRVNDMRIVNAPIVGSDYRIKETPESIPQALCDFVMSTEIQQYVLKGHTRTHYGIVITQEFLTGIANVVDLDNFGPLCHDLFVDDEGETVTRTINTVELGEVWQVRYDEWQNITLEAMRRKISAM
jgi:hypothetical protein